MMACGPLALPGLAATAIKSPRFACNTQHQCFQFSVQRSGCFFCFLQPHVCARVHTWSACPMGAHVCVHLRCMLSSIEAMKSFRLGPEESGCLGKIRHAAWCCCPWCEYARSPDRSYGSAFKCSSRRKEDQILRPFVCRNCVGIYTFLYMIVKSDCDGLNFHTNI